MGSLDGATNRIVFVPSTDLRCGSTAKYWGEDAERLLRRCVDDHAETPWAYLAQRELETVRLATLDLEVRFEEGETLHTEISRKFTREQIASLLERSGLRLECWFTPPNDYFSLTLARPA
jgi:hypothetical protein